MNIIPFQPRQQPDDLDRLLHDYFRSEMPEAWPAPPVPAAEPSSPSWWQRSRSRFVLAASIALLLGGSWWLSGTAPEYRAPVVDVGRGSGDANKKAADGVLNKVKDRENNTSSPANTQR